MTTTIPQTGDATVRYAAPPTPEALARRLGLPIEQLCKLDANESPYGPPPRALSALARLGAASCGRYPDPAATELREALAESTRLPAGCIVVGNGSDELIGLLAELLLGPGDEAVVAEPTFSLYGIVAARRGARIVDAGTGADFALSPERLVASLSPRTRIVFVCAPNNPTGAPLPPGTVEALLAATEDADGPLIVVDEAYYEFGALTGDARVRTATPLVASGRVVVLRTFSKLFGLAGLRIGYACCPEALAVRLRERKLPYNVNAAGLVAARAALDERDWLGERAREIAAERERVARALAALPSLRVYPSAANFHLVEVAGGPQRCAEVWNGLLDRGILVRRYEGGRLASCLRVTVGTPEQNDRLLAALGEIEEGKG